MALREQLTNEELTKRFPNESSFELTRRAIAMAQRRIKAGRGFNLGSLIDELKKEDAIDPENSVIDA